MKWLIKLKELFKDLWLHLNGNKSLIGMTLIAVLQTWQLPQPWQSIALALISIWTGVSLKHHYDKGYFGKDKGS